MSVEGQDGRAAKRAKMLHDRRESPSLVLIGLGTGFDVGYRAALVGSEARERELVEIAAKERGHAARHLDRALKAEARERELEAAWEEQGESLQLEVARREEFRRLWRERGAREAVLVEALKEIAEAKEGQRGSEVGLDFRAKLQAIARSALAGVVEAQPDRQEEDA